jgi:uncharacterized protein YjbI with pentapeptide repeats
MVAAIVGVLAAVTAVAFVVVAYRRRWGWTGFSEPAGEAPRGKTLWDWLQLLIVPAVLVGAAFALNLAQSSRDQRREDRRAAVERSIALEQRREDALAAYLDEMAALLRHGQVARQTLAMSRTLTLSVLRRLDGQRKGFVVQFLAEGGLAKPAVAQLGLAKGSLIKLPPSGIDLAGADLRGAVVRGTLANVALDGADLRAADFQTAFLSNVTMSLSDLRNATFAGAQFDLVWIDGADLRGANLSRTLIGRSYFNSSCLTDARLSGATIFDSSFEDATGRNIDLSGTTVARLKWKGVSFAGLDLTGVSFEDGATPPAGSVSAKQAECGGPRKSLKQVAAGLRG